VGLTSNCRTSGDERVRGCRDDLAHYFFTRKLDVRALRVAFVVFPGGYGRSSELFEALTLILEGKAERFPVVLAGSAYWARPARVPAAIAALPTGKIPRQTSKSSVSIDDPRAIVSRITGVVPCHRVTG